MNMHDVQTYYNSQHLPHVSETDALEKKMCPVQFSSSFAMIGSLLTYAT